MQRKPSMEPPPSAVVPRSTFKYSGEVHSPTMVNVSVVRQPSMEVLLMVTVEPTSF